MSLWAFSAVLCAAFLHALWNAIVKGAADRTLVLGLVALGHVVPGVALAMVAPMPAITALPYIVASTMIHWGYYWLLNVAYRSGDLSVVYPIARGLTPIMIALGAMIWADEILPVAAWIGILAISLGILLLSWDVVASRVARSGLLAAIGVAVIIAGYSIVDGIGIRVSGSPVGYIGWLFTAEVFVVGFIFTTRWPRLRALPTRTMALAFSGGLVSSLAYGLVLYVKTEAPLGLVSALRETSVIFAALMGIYWFNEGPRTRRFAAAAIVALGVATIALARA